MRLWGEQRVSQRSLWTQRSLAFGRQPAVGDVTLQSRLYARDYRDRLFALTEIFPLGEAGVPLLLAACGDPHGGVRALALNCLSAFGDQAAVAQLLETVAQWRGMRCVQTLRAHDAAVTGLMMRPDDQVVASTAADGGEMQFWNLVDGKHLSCVEAAGVHQGWNSQVSSVNYLVNITAKNISAIATNQSQSTLAIATKDGTLKVLCLKTQRKRWINQLDDCCEIMSLEFDPEGRVLWTGDRRSRLSSWNVETGELIDTWGSWHDRGILQLITIPESPVVLHSCGMTVKIWHRKIGFLIHELIGHRAAVGAIAATQNGQRVVTGSDDGVIKIWQVGG